MEISSSDPRSLILELGKICIRRMANTAVARGFTPRQFVVVAIQGQKVTSGPGSGLIACEVVNHDAESHQPADGSDCLMDETRIGTVSYMAVTLELAVELAIQISPKAAVRLGQPLPVGEFFVLVLSDAGLALICCRIGQAMALA